MENQSNLEVSNLGVMTSQSLIMPIYSYSNSLFIVVLIRQFKKNIIIRLTYCHALCEFLAIHTAIF